MSKMLDYAVFFLILAFVIGGFAMDGTFGSPDFDDLGAPVMEWILAAVCVVLAVVAAMTGEPPQRFFDSAGNLLKDSTAPYKKKPGTKPG